jgi:MoaA/NifB/PqqE/SkfB family radical SAM enzyme/SAM-dependent methyltransferase
MTFDPSRWTRFAVDTTAVWLCPDRPNWFVPTMNGDKLLQEPAQPDSHSKLFLQRLPDPPQSSYQGRQSLLADTPILQELWLHITDRCNLACSHCLFSSGPDQTRELPLEQLKQHVDAAAAQGCRLFALTGGEPLVHPDFNSLIDHILAIPDSRIAILTNGLLVAERLQTGWPRERIHLQISLDGRPEHHDQLRGKGAFHRLERQLVWLKQQEWQFTLSCCVTSENAQDLVWLVEYAADQGASTVHLMWHFIRGRGSNEQHVDPLSLLNPVLSALKRAEERSITIDNIESLKGQIFSPPGTIHDGSSAGWEAAAIGPDNRLYPSAATIGLDELATGLENGLLDAWLNSPILAQIRMTSVVALSDPWRFLLGGGDLDHCYHHAGSFIGTDPYQPLFEQLALQLINQAATRLPEPELPGLRLKMGELLVSCGSHGPVALCHTNCLLALDGSHDSRSQVGRYYAEAAGDKRLEILNPVHYDEQMMSHIPPAYRFRGYGCGSPVLDADLKPGEQMVDLGCGSGVECFIAARMVGATGMVTGVDMLDPMLDLARTAAIEVQQELGYNNLQFLRGFLESLPLPDNSQDLVVSNCVLNLSADKRSTFAEILRILKPGGRLAAADVVCETEPDAAILNDETLRGECISGAMTQKDLLGILEETGFSGFKVIKRLPYRTVNGHSFYSVTFSMMKPEASAATVQVLYPGPASALLTASGITLRPGQTTQIPKTDAELLGNHVWQLDSHGFVSNVTIEAGANCALPPETRSTAPKYQPLQHDSGCLICGAPLVYHATEQQTSCHFCGKTLPANACCEMGHFVCDSCHTGDALELIEHLCSASTTTDAIQLFTSIRQHPSIPLHGPQYHALVPGVLLACLRNAGYPVTSEQLHAAIQRGGEVCGGSCGFWGVCGAATGVGIAFSVILEATPLKAEGRQTVQQVVQQVLSEIAGYKAARCCQRDCWIALRSGLLLAAELWTLNLPEVEPFACTQMARNKECLGIECPLWP